jgi:DNA-binding MarR family transcriptional regulator
MDESARDKEHDIWIMLDQAHAAINAAREKELRQYNLSTMKSAVLFDIEQIGSEVTPAELSRWLLRRSHSVSGLLNRMAKDGLVKKTKDLHRKNLVRITVTEKGKQAYKDSLSRVSIHQLMYCLSVEERKQLYSSLEKLRNMALQETGTPKPPYP